MNIHLKQFFWALSGYFKAIIFIAKHKIWLYFIPPAILSGLIYYAGTAIEDILHQYDIEQVESFNELMFEIFKMLGMYILTLMAFKMRKYIVFVLLSPLLAHLSYVVEKKITGNNYTTSFSQLIKDIRRGIRIAIGNFLLEYLLISAWIILALFIPGMSLATPVFMFLVGCYFYGFSMIDYINERRKMTISQSVVYVRKNAGFAFGNGFIFTALFYLPYHVGILFAPILAIVACGIGMHYYLDKNLNSPANEKNTQTN